MTSATELIVKRLAVDEGGQGLAFVGAARFETGDAPLPALAGAARAHAPAAWRLVVIAVAPEGVTFTYHLGRIECIEMIGGGSHERTRLGNDRFWTVGVRMAVERPVNYLLKEKAGSTMLELKTFLIPVVWGPLASQVGLILRVYKKGGQQCKPLNYSHNFSGLVQRAL